MTGKTLHLRHQCGQALILVALAMPLFMSIAALVVDGTNLMVHRRQLQTASDGSALAASQELGPYLGAATGSATCDATWSTQATVQPRPKLVSVIQDYSSKNNGPAILNGGSCAADPARCAAASDTNCYTWPYKGSTGLIEVRLRESVGGFITNAVDALLPGNPLGSTFNASARAVASAAPVTHVIPGTTSTSTSPGFTDPGSTVTNSSTTTTPGQPGTPIAIFAFTHCGTSVSTGVWTVDGTKCDPCGNGITVTGNPQTSIDAVLSNGTVNANSTGVQIQGLYAIGWAGYGAPPRSCAKAGNHQANVGVWAQQAAAVQWPRLFDRASICTGHDHQGTLSLNSPADGVYCSDTAINVTGLGGGNTYNLTLVAPIVGYVRHQIEYGKQVTVLLSEVEPTRRRYQVLHNQRGLILAAALRSRTDAIVAILAFRLRAR